MTYREVHDGQENPEMFNDVRLHLGSGMSFLVAYDACVFPAPHSWKVLYKISQGSRVTVAGTPKSCDGDVMAGGLRWVIADWGDPFSRCFPGLLLTCTFPRRPIWSTFIHWDAVLPPSSMHFGGRSQMRIRGHSGVLYRAVGVPSSRGRFGGLDECDAEVPIQPKATCCSLKMVLENSHQLLTITTWCLWAPKPKADLKILNHWRCPWKEQNKTYWAVLSFHKMSEFCSVCCPLAGLDWHCGPEHRSSQAATDRASSAAWARPSTAREAQDRPPIKHHWFHSLIHPMAFKCYPVHLIQLLVHLCLYIFVM